MINGANPVNQYPIRTLSELTGIPTTTLRAWERRYGLLKPQRTPKGHRLYSDQDIELIGKISVLLRDNHTIREAMQIVRGADSETAAPASNLDHWARFQQKMLNAVEQFNEQTLDQVYNDALAVYPIDLVTQQVIVPVLKTLGQRWQERDAGIAEEHFFSSFLRNKLGARFHHEAHRSRGRRLLAACLPGEHHELGLMLYCMAAIGRGYRVLYLGADMPVQQLPLVAARTGAAGILVSGSEACEWSEGLREQLQQCLTAVEIPLMFGGEFSDRYAARIADLGGHGLGSDHSQALLLMNNLLPAFAQS